MDGREKGRSRKKRPKQEKRVITKDEIILILTLIQTISSLITTLLTIYLILYK